MIPRGTLRLSLSIFNRPSLSDRAAGLRVEASVDGQTWRELWRASDVRAVWEVELEQPADARHLRLSLASGILHLRQLRA